MQPPQSMMTIDDDNFNCGDPEGRVNPAQTNLSNWSKPGTICSFWKFGSCRNRRLNPATIMHSDVTAGNRTRAVNWTVNSYSFKTEAKDGGCPQINERDQRDKGAQQSAKIKNLNPVVVLERDNNCQTVTSSLTSQQASDPGTVKNTCDCCWQQQGAPEKAMGLQRLEDDVNRKILIHTDPRILVNDNDAGLPPENNRKYSRYAIASNRGENRSVSCTTHRQRLPHRCRPIRFPRRQKRPADRSATALYEVVKPGIIPSIPTENCRTDKQRNVLSSYVESSGKEFRRGQSRVFNKNRNSDHSYVDNKMGSRENKMEASKERERSLANRKQTEREGLVRCRVAGANGIEVWVECNLDVLTANKRFKSDERRRGDDEITSIRETTTGLRSEVNLPKLQNELMEASYSKEKNDDFFYLADKQIAENSAESKTQKKVEIISLDEDNDDDSRDQKIIEQLKVEAQVITEAAEGGDWQQISECQQFQTKNIQVNPGCNYRRGHNSEQMPNYLRNSEYSSLRLKHCAVKLQKLSSEAIESYMPRRGQYKSQLLLLEDVLMDHNDTCGCRIDDHAAASAVKLEHENSYTQRTSVEIARSSDNITVKAADLDDVIVNVPSNKPDETNFHADGVTEIHWPGSMSDFLISDDNTVGIVKSTKGRNKTGIINNQTKLTLVPHPKRRIGNKNHQSRTRLPPSDRAPVKGSVGRNQTTKKQKIKATKARQQTKTNSSSRVAQQNKDIDDGIAVKSAYCDTSNEGKNLSVKSSAAAFKRDSGDGLIETSRQRKGNRMISNKGSATVRILNRKQRSSGVKTALLTPKFKITHEKVRPTKKLATSKAAVHSKVHSRCRNVWASVKTWKLNTSQNDLHWNSVENTVDDVAAAAAAGAYSRDAQVASVDAAEESSQPLTSTPLMNLTEEQVTTVASNTPVESTANDSTDPLQSSPTDFNDLHEGVVKRKPRERKVGSWSSAQCNVTSTIRTKCTELGRDVESGILDERNDSHLNPRLQPVIMNQQPPACVAPHTPAADTIESNDGRCLVPLTPPLPHAHNLLYRMAHLMSAIMYLRQTHKRFPSLTDRERHSTNDKFATFFEDIRSNDDQSVFRQNDDMLSHSDRTFVDDKRDARLPTNSGGGLPAIPDNENVPEPDENRGQSGFESVDLDLEENDQLDHRPTEVFGYREKAQNAAKSAKDYNCRSEVAHCNSSDNDSEDWRGEHDVEPEVSDLEIRKRHGATVEKLRKKLYKSLFPDSESSYHSDDCCNSTKVNTKRTLSSTETSARAIHKDTPLLRYEFGHFDDSLSKAVPKTRRRRKHRCVIYAEKGTDSSDLNDVINWTSEKESQQPVQDVKLRLVRCMKKRRNYGVQTEDSGDEKDSTADREHAKEKRTISTAVNTAENSSSAFDEYPASNVAPCRSSSLDVSSPAIFSRDLSYYDDQYTMDNFPARPFWFPPYQLYSPSAGPYHQHYRQWNQQRYGSDFDYSHPTNRNTWSKGPGLGHANDCYNSHAYWSSYGGEARTAVANSETCYPSRQYGYPVASSSNNSCGSSNSQVPATFNSYVTPLQASTYNNSVNNSCSLVGLTDSNELGVKDGTDATSSNDINCGDILAAAVEAAGVSLTADTTLDVEECSTEAVNEIANETTSSTQPCDGESLKDFSTIELADLMQSGASDDLDKEPFQDSEKLPENIQVSDNTDTNQSKSPLSSSLLSFPADGLSLFDYGLDLSVVVDEHAAATTTTTTTTETVNESTVDDVSISQHDVTGQGTANDADVTADNISQQRLTLTSTDKSEDVVVVDDDVDGTGGSLTLWNLDGPTSTELRRTLLLGDDFHDMLLDQTLPPVSSPQPLASVALPTAPTTPGTDLDLAAECCSRALALNYNRRDTYDVMPAMCASTSCSSSCRPVADAVKQSSAFRKYRGSRRPYRRNTVGYSHNSSYFRNPWCYPFLPPPGLLWPGMFPWSTGSPYSSSHWNSRSIELHRRSSFSPWSSGYGEDNNSDNGSGSQYYFRQNHSRNYLNGNDWSNF